MRIHHSAHPSAAAASSSSAPRTATVHRLSGSGMERADGSPRADLPEAQLPITWLSEGSSRRAGHAQSHAFQQQQTTPGCQHRRQHPQQRPGKPCRGRAHDVGWPLRRSLVAAMYLSNSLTHSSSLTAPAGNASDADCPPPLLVAVGARPGSPPPAACTLPTGRRHLVWDRWSVPRFSPRSTARN